MKSSAFKLALIVSAVFFPLVIWAILTQPQDIRSRADESLTPTATPSATPTATITPSATPTVTLTPTPTNSPPICLGISANPGAGAKPLTVNFSCAGYDANNDITAAEFGFGAGQKETIEKNVGQYGSITDTHTYTSPGSYNVTCHVRDNNNAWSDYPSFCTYTVVVSDNALTPTPIRTPMPTQPIPTSSAPIVYTGNAFTPPSPQPTPFPTLVSPSPAPKPTGWWTNDKIMQLITMVVVSGITIIVALFLHNLFDKHR